MPVSQVTVEACPFPQMSVLYPDTVRKAYYRDSYRTPSSRLNATAADVFHGIFSHRPAWMKRVMLARNGLASMCGIAAPTAAEILRPEIRDSYAVGDQIGAWPIFALSGNELVAGRDNKHLDFRVSVLRTLEGPTPNIVVSTVCIVHGRFGRVYLFFIVPFHRWGLRRLISAAARAGRI